MLPICRPADIHVIEGSGDRLRDPAALPRVCITSYDMLRRVKVKVKVKLGAESERGSGVQAADLRGLPAEGGAEAGGGRRRRGAGAAVQGRRRGLHGGHAVEGETCRGGQCGGPNQQPGLDCCCPTRVGSTGPGGQEDDLKCPGRPQVVICDESHAMRSTAAAAPNRPENAKTEAAAAVVRRAKRAILLSGTPSLSRPFDLFLQVRATGAGAGGVERRAGAGGATSPSPRTP